MFRRLAFAVFVVFSGAAARAEIIDRVIAVVDGYLITLSDARAALKFELVPADVATDPVSAAMQRLVDRRLMVAEIDRYAPPEPSAEAIDAGVKAVQSRFADALAFEIALNQSAMSHEELRRHVRDSLRIAAYLEQRFVSSVQISDAEIERYHAEHPREFTVDGALQPLGAVREEVRAKLVANRRAAVVREWLDGLRRRANILMLYLPGRA